MEPSAPPTLSPTLERYGDLLRIALILTLKALGCSCYINYITCFLLQQEKRFPAEYTVPVLKLSYLLSMCCCSPDNFSNSDLVLTSDFHLYSCSYSAKIFCFWSSVLSLPIVLALLAHVFGLKYLSRPYWWLSLMPTAGFQILLPTDSHPDYFIPSLPSSTIPTPFLIASKLWFLFLANFLIFPW